MILYVYDGIRIIEMSFGNQLELALAISAIAEEKPIAFIESEVSCFAIIKRDMPEASAVGKFVEGDGDCAGDSLSSYPCGYIVFYAEIIRELESLAKDTCFFIPAYCNVLY